MAGTLTISTLSDGTNSTSATNPILGSAKAWVNFNGTSTVAIRASYNVSSVTDNGTGLYTVNFTTAMPNNNYAAVASTRRNTGVSGENNVNNGVNFRGASGYSTAFTTTAVQICTGAVTDEGLYDFDYVAVTVFSS